MADWTSSMQQTFEFYVVDPGTWRDVKRLDTVKSCTISRDLEVDTLGSATIDIVESVGECYIRVYLVTIQNGIRERHPLGTYLVQTPSSTFDGKNRSVSMDAYTPLLELKENSPPIGYYIPKTIYYKVNFDGSGYEKTEETMHAAPGKILTNPDGSYVKTQDGDKVFKIERLETQISDPYIYDGDASVYKIAKPSKITMTATYRDFANALRSLECSLDLTAYESVTFKFIGIEAGDYDEQGEEYRSLIFRYELDGNEEQMTYTPTSWTRIDEAHISTLKLQSVKMDGETFYRLNDGYYCLSETALDMAYSLTTDKVGGYKKVRAPVIKPECNVPLTYDFVADTNDSWLTYLNALVTGAKYRFDLDAMGRIMFTPNVSLDAMQPIWTYDDSNSSILYPEISMDHDLFGIPNVVEVVYFDGITNHYVRKVNDDPNSPTSTVRRGREIKYRVTDPDLIGLASKDDPIIDEYAITLLESLSTIEYTIKYTHGYCPVKIGDCVRLNYSRAGLTNIKAKVINQSIKCEPGCPVTETAIYTAKLWSRG